MQAVATNPTSSTRTSGNTRPATRHYKLVGGQYPAILNPDGTWDILNVRNFSEIPRGSNNNQIPVDGAWHERAIRLHKVLEGEGYLPPLHVYHHDDSPLKISKPEFAGFYRLKSRTIARVKGKPQSVLVADLVRVPHSVFQRIDRGELPFISVETPRGYTETEILSAALLDSEPPYCPLPLITIGSKTRALHGRRRACASTYRIARWLHMGGGASVNAQALLRPASRKPKEDDVSDDREEHAIDRPKPIASGKSDPDPRNAGKPSAMADYAITRAHDENANQTGRGRPGTLTRHEADDEDAEEHAMTGRSSGDKPAQPSSPDTLNKPAAGKPELIRTRTSNISPNAISGNKPGDGGRFGVARPKPHASDTDDMDQHSHDLADIEAPEDNTELVSHARGGPQPGAGPNVNAAPKPAGSGATGRPPSGDQRFGHEPEWPGTPKPGGKHMEDKTEIVSHADGAAAPAGEAPAAAPAIDMASLSKLVAKELFALMHGEGQAEPDEIDPGPAPVEPETFAPAAGDADADKYPDEEKMPHARNARTRPDPKIAALEAKIAALEAVNTERARAQQHSRMIREAEGRIAHLHVSDATRNRIREIAKHGKDALNVFIETLEETLPSDPPETFDAFAAPRRLPENDPELEQFRTEGPDTLAFAREHLPRYRELHKRGHINRNINFRDYLKAQVPNRPIWDDEDEAELQAKRKA